MNTIAPWLLAAALGLPLAAAAQPAPGSTTQPGDPAPRVPATAHLPDLDLIDPVRFDYAAAIEEN